MILDSAHENPFASTHSLDTNPFDDPPQQQVHAAREEELRRREADLQRRETELHNKSEHIRRHGRNNFPPCALQKIPSSAPILDLRQSSFFFFSLVLPLIFHSIKDEIPEANRQTITRLFQLWLVLLGTLLINFVACLILLIGGSSSGGPDLGSSLGSVSPI